MTTGERRMMERICMCGHVEDEHGGMSEYPGSMKCHVDKCKCVHFEANEDEDEQEN